MGFGEDKTFVFRDTGDLTRHNDVRLAAVETKKGEETSKYTDKHKPRHMMAFN